MIFRLRSPAHEKDKNLECRKGLWIRMELSFYRHYSHKESARGMGQNITKPAQSVRNFVPRNSKFFAKKEK